MGWVAHMHSIRHSTLQIMFKPALKPDKRAALFKTIKKQRKNKQACIKRLNAVPLLSLEVLYLNSRRRHTTIFPKPVKTSSQKNPSHNPSHSVTAETTKSVCDTFIKLNMLC